jgi:glycosyltransferase involved in cell wall biosynthesis
VELAFWLIIFVLFGYLCFVTILHYQWNKIPYFIPARLSSTTPISVIIAAKNESTTISQLLDSINKQSLSPTLFEVLIINDHSTDEMEALINDWKNKFKPEFHLELILNVGKGKKSCIETGIKKAKNEYIVCTDADCRFAENWLKTISNFLEIKKPDFVFGLVTISSDSQKVKTNNAVWENWQTIEHASLVGSGASTWQMGLPTMCNGANMAFSKTVFAKVGGYEGNTHIQSGDDEFLMHKIYQHSPQKVYFLKSKEAIVHTQPAENWQEFNSQRSRWASKWESYQYTHIQLIALIVFVANIGTLFVYVSSFWWFQYVLFSIAVAIIVLRWFIEYQYLKNVLLAMDKKLKIGSFLSLLFIYPFYVVYFGLKGRFKT